MEQIKSPNPLPQADYLALITGFAEFTQRGKNNTDCVIFPVKLAQCLSADPNVQTAVGEALDGKPLGDVKLNYLMWATPDSAYRIKQFLQNTLQITGAANLSEALSMVPGRQLVVSLSHYISNKDKVGEDPQVTMEIKATKPAPNYQG
jgi:hypothetical protein